MVKKWIEINDTLQEQVASAINETSEVLLEFLEDNPDTFEDEDDDPPCLHNDIDHGGRFHEIVDGFVPIHTSEIEDTWYLYASELEEAYENAGVGDNPRENNGMAAIYYYIYAEVCEWYSDHAQEICVIWLRRHNSKCNCNSDDEMKENTNG